MPSAYSSESRNNASPYPENPFITPQTSRNSSIMEGEEKISHKAKQGAKRVRRYLNNELRSPYTSLILVVCFFTSGLIDATAFYAWSAFVGMQTGKTWYGRPDEEMADQASQETQSSLPWDYPASPYRRIANNTTSHLSPSAPSCWAPSSSTSCTDTPD